MCSFFAKHNTFDYMHMGCGWDGLSNYSFHSDMLHMKKDFQNNKYVQNDLCNICNSKCLHRHVV